MNANALNAKEGHMAMKWWVFNDEQLRKALDAWRSSDGFAARRDELVTSSPDNTAADDVVSAFLLSDVARAHGLRGDKEQ